ncbi:MAG TPA: diacylglycerol kinase [Candidatus Dormibacteraeota bacterium]|nr:diacylglycerol kinase [Candidatus Dormibacteraeota bacterium]
MSPQHWSSGFVRLRRSFEHAVEGIIYAARTQPNLRTHFIIAIAVLIATLFLHLRITQIAVVIVLVALVIGLELMNTSIESVVDLLTATHHPLAKSAKDAAAGAVFIAAFAAVGVGALIFLPAFHLPLLLSFAVLAIVAILTVIGKALFGGGTPLHGGAISGHASLAFAAATLVTLSVSRPIPALLAYLVAGLVAQSRVEGGIHSWGEVLWGALLGTLVALLIGALLGHLML